MEEPLDTGLAADKDTTLFKRMISSLKVTADEDKSYATMLAPTDRVSLAARSHAVWRQLAERVVLSPVRHVHPTRHANLPDPGKSRGFARDASLFIVTALICPYMCALRPPPNPAGGQCLPGGDGAHL